MGLRYVLFRGGYELMRKSGLLKWKFPVKPDHKVYVDLATWRTDAPPFFFHSGNDIKKPDLRQEALLQLKDQAEHVLRGDILFFWWNLVRTEQCLQLMNQSGYRLYLR